ncbi:hypothetical protein SCLCIDRAFT_190950 [Scleroderma citrinum Foug A]|uniref:Uncharacterized protein n=1 Tax=Scleroderma citrinum Foug A TaxID=1036808 RepID=A0A0C2ZWX0_9AGAM|nr:hypothetical protein SCLCIDRAFT_190950 [Scleroderma citrinum Foug A]
MPSILRRRRRRGMHIVLGSRRERVVMARLATIYILQYHIPGTKFCRFERNRRFPPTMLATSWKKLSWAPPRRSCLSFSVTWNRTVFDHAEYEENNNNCRVQR